MPRGRIQSSRFGQTQDAQATAIGLPVVTTATVTLTSKPTANYINQRVDALGHLLFVRYDMTGLPVRMKDDAGNGGWGTVKLATAPLGYAKVLSAKSNITRATVNNSASVSGTGIDSDFVLTYAVGSASATSAASTPLGSTKGNIIPSTVCATAASSVSAGSVGYFGKTSSTAGTFTSTETGTSITDSSGGTAAATITSIVTGATVVAATQNAFASLAKELNDLIGETTISLELDGSATANFYALNCILADGDVHESSDDDVVGDLLVTGYVELLYLFYGAS